MSAKRLSDTDLADLERFASESMSRCNDEACCADAFGHDRAVLALIAEVRELRARPETKMLAAIERVGRGVYVDWWVLRCGDRMANVRPELLADAEERIVDLILERFATEPPVMQSRECPGCKRPWGDGCACLPLP
jgi:hypothetical protein